MPARAGRGSLPVKTMAFSGEVEIVGFDALTASMLHNILKLRFDVFVLEQKSLYPEIDGADPVALHLIVRDGGEICGTLRILDLAAPGGPVKIGRVAVHPDQRGTGLGRQMMQAALAHIDRQAPGRPVSLGAQCQLESFYASFGFKRCSDIYDDGGIDHVDMTRPPVNEAL